MVPEPTKSAVLAGLLAVPIALAVTAAPTPRLAATVKPMAAAGLTDSRCAARATIADTLSDTFAAVPTLAALTGTGMTMELWTSDGRGTWTMVHHAPDGISCIVTEGGDWQPGGDAARLLDRALAETVHGS